MFTKHIPNALTMGNLLCGCLAVWQAFRYDFELAAVLVLVAALCDVLDGWAARLLGVHSELGMQLDSLADVVSFGVAPAMLLLNYLMAHAGRPMDASYLAPFVVVLASAYRLARFNVRPTNSSDFEGLPTPANGLYLTALPLAASLSPTLHAVLVHPLGMLVLCALQAYFLVSFIPFMALKGRQGWRGWWPIVLLCGLVGIVLVFWPAWAAPAGMLSYLLLSTISRRKAPTHAA